MGVRRGDILRVYEMCKYILSRLSWEMSQWRYRLGTVQWLAVDTTMEHHGMFTAGYTLPGGSDVISHPPQTRDDVLVTVLR